MRRIIDCSLSCLLALGAGSPLLAKGPSGWLAGAESALLLPEEKALLEDASPDGRAELAQLLWARRDPDLETPANEFRIDFEARVRAADLQFGEPDLAGSLTDRGRTLILLGAPVERRKMRIVDVIEALYRDRPSGGSHPALGMGADSQGYTDSLRHIHGLVASDWFEDVAGSSSLQEANDPTGKTLRHGVRFDVQLGVADVWIFREGELPGPAGAEDPDAVVAVLFFDHFGTGRYRLETGIRGCDAAVEALAMAPAALVAHPDLWRLPD